MDKKSPQKLLTESGWWVGFRVSGKIKCGVFVSASELVKHLFLILKSVGSLPVFLSKFVGLQGRPTMRHNSIIPASPLPQFFIFSFPSGR